MCVRAWLCLWSESLGRTIWSNKAHLIAPVSISQTLLPVCAVKLRHGGDSRRQSTHAPYERQPPSRRAHARHGARGQLCTRKLYVTLRCSSSRSQLCEWRVCVRVCVLNERKIIPAHHLHTCRKSYLYLWLLKIVAVRQRDGWRGMWRKENIVPGHHWMNKAMSPAMTTIMIKVSARIKADTKLRLHQRRR